MALSIISGKGDKTALICRAIEAQDESSVKSILILHNTDLDPNETIPGIRMTLLHFAVGHSNNFPEIVRLLLNKGGDPNNTATEDHLSPMHLSVIYDYDRVLQSLMEFGGDPKIPGGDNKTCYDIAKENVENSLEEKCFLYFYRKSLYFRKSIKPSDSVAMAWRSHHSQTLSLTNISSGSNGFITCESDFEHVDLLVKDNDFPSLNESESASNQLMVNNVNEKDNETQNESKNSINASIEESRLTEKYSYLMTDDESGPYNSSGDNGRLSTIEEESAITASFQRRLGYDSIEDRSGFSLSVSSNEPSCANSTPPIQPEPSKSQLLNLQTKMKAIGVPVTQSTYRVLNQYAHDRSKLKEVLAPKPGTVHFSSELRMSMENLELIYEWGNLQIDLLQNATPTTKVSKSFYNYLLLDPKIIKRTNFSGSHLKHDIIKNPEKFQTFLKSIFYIGKGCGKRPIQHLVDAKAKYVPGRRQLSNEEKLDKILNIWKSGLGVIVVSMFHHSSEREANVHEAAMIDAVGLYELSNIKKGSYGGTIATSWSQKTKNQFGSLLLYKSFCAFTVSEHKSFYPQDI